MAGDFSLVRPSKLGRFRATLKKVLQYFSTSFVLLMTVVDVVDASRVTEISKAEGALKIADNFNRMLSYISQDSVSVMDKLRGIKNWSKSS